MLGFFGPAHTLDLSDLWEQKIPTVWLLPRQLPALMPWSARLSLDRKTNSIRRPPDHGESDRELAVDCAILAGSRLDFDLILFSCCRWAE
jgi:hypothetical protein